MMARIMAEPALPDFRRLDYLAGGSADQRHVWSLLRRHDPFAALAPLDWALAGTFPLDIQVPGSDLDILVAVDEPAALVGHLPHLYGHLPGFTQHIGQFADGPALVAGFMLQDVPVEIFAQARPVEQQMAWRHMVVEARLLAAFPDSRAAIRSLKRAGMKTEPAFASHFGLEGDPYQALLALETVPDLTVSPLILKGFDKKF